AENDEQVYVGVLNIVAEVAGHDEQRAESDNRRHVLVAWRAYPPRQAKAEVESDPLKRFEYHNRPTAREVRQRDENRQEEWRIQIVRPLLIDGLRRTLEFRCG